MNILPLQRWYSSGDYKMRGWVEGWQVINVCSFHHKTDFLLISGAGRGQAWPGSVWGPAGGGEIRTIFQWHAGSPSALRSDLPYFLFTKLGMNGCRNVVKGNFSSFYDLHQSPAISIITFREIDFHIKMKISLADWSMIIMAMFSHQTLLRLFVNVAEEGGREGGRDGTVHILSLL